MPYTNEQRRSLAQLCSRIAAAALRENVDFAQACRDQMLDYDGMSKIITDMVIHAEGHCSAVAGKDPEDGNDHRGEEADRPVPRRAPSWMYHLYRSVVADEPENPAEREEAVKRLQDAMLSIPDFEQYACLVREFSGTWPAPRPGRPDDGNRFDSIGQFDGMSRTADILLKQAKAFLLKPNRKNYVITGFTELPAHFSEDVIRTLNATQIYVPDDLERFPKNEILSIPDATPKLIAQVYDYRVRVSGGSVSDVPGA